MDETNRRWDVLAIPLNPRDWVELRIPRVVSRDEWTQMMAVLEAMRPALVTATQPPERAGEEPRTYEFQLVWESDCWYLLLGGTLPEALSGTRHADWMEVTMRPHPHITKPPKRAEEGET